MKSKIVLLVMVLTTAVFSACKKDKQVKQADDLYLTASKDNTKWVTNWHTYADIDDAKNYMLVGINKEENLRIGLTVNSLNQYVLIENKTEFYVTVGLDAVVARYVLDNSTTNTVNVTKHDIKNVLIEGDFKLKFKKTYGADSYPAIVNFTDGKFKMSKAYD